MLNTFLYKGKQGANFTIVFLSMYPWLWVDCSLGMISTHNRLPHTPTPPPHKLSVPNHYDYLDRSRCWTLDLSLLSSSILSLNQFYFVGYSVFHSCFSPFTPPSWISSCCFAFGVSLSPFDLEVIFVVSLFILWRLPLVSWCSMSIWLFSLIASCGYFSCITMSGAQLRR